MTPEILKRAVELADGWEWTVALDGKTEYIWSEDEFDWPVADLPQYVKDCIAAQLVRQVDALDPDNTLVEACYYGDRTDNTITAIVESGVLKGDKS